LYYLDHFAGVFLITMKSTISANHGSLNIANSYSSGKCSFMGTLDDDAFGRRDM